MPEIAEKPIIIAEQKIKKPRLKKINDKQNLSAYDYNPPSYFYERLVPKSPKELSNLATEMVTWARKPTSLVWTNFANERNPPLSRGDLYKWAETSEDLKAAIELTKQILAARREEGAMLFKLNQNAIRETQPLYDAEYRDWKLQAIKATSAQVAQLNIIRPDFPVPEKKDEE